MANIEVPRYLLKPFYALRNRTFLLPVSCMHHCINTRQITIITAALCYQPGNRSLQHPFNQTQTADRGSQEEGRGERGFLETRTKSDTKSRGRVARGGRSQTSNTQSLLLLREKISYWTRRQGDCYQMRKCRELRVLSRQRYIMTIQTCPPAGLLHKNWDLRN